MLNHDQPINRISCCSFPLIYAAQSVNGAVQEEKSKKHKKRHRSERDAEPASDPEQLPGPKVERTAIPDFVSMPSTARQQDTAAERAPVAGRRPHSGSPIPRRPAPMQDANRQMAAAEKPAQAPKVTGQVCSTTLPR